LSIAAISPSILCAVRRLHEIAQDSERRHLIRRTVGERHRCQLRRLSGGQTELDPPAEQQAGGDAMAAADLRHGNA
jgi:hypothetical protein